MKKIILLIISFLLVSVPANAVDYTVIPTIATVDGTTFCGGSACTASDTILIEAGARGGLLFQNFNGNGSYITIKNKTKSPSTPVTITNNYGPGYGVLNLNNCKYVDLRGDNDPALIATDRQKGIIVNGIGNAVSPKPKAGTIIVYGISDHVKVSYIESNNLNNTTGSGIGIMLQDLTLNGTNSFTDMEFHHLWIHDTRAQGGYFGHNDPYGVDSNYSPLKTHPHLRRISIHDNIFEDIGCEGFDLKGCDQGPNEFYNNKIIRTGVQTDVGDSWAIYLNYGAMQAGLKIAFTTHETAVNVHDNYFEATGGPSIMAHGSYYTSLLNTVDGGLGGRIYVYNNIIVNAGVHGGAIPYQGNITVPANQSAIASWVNNYHCDVYDNIIIQPNKYGLVVGQSGDVMTARRNLIGDAGTAATYVISGASYTEGTGGDVNVYHADVTTFGFTAWSDNNNYADDVFTFPDESIAAPANFHCAVNGTDTAYFTWSASANATGYRIYYGPTTGTYLYTRDVGNVTSYTVNSSDIMFPAYFAILAYSTAGDSDLSNEVGFMRVVTTLTGNAALDIALVQLMESGTDQTIAVTPSGNHRVTAYKIGDTWTDWPGVNTVPLGTVSEDKTIKIVTQTLPTLTGL